VKKERKNSCSGFTLIELLVVVTIMMVILGAGIASYFNLSERQNLVNAGKQLQEMMRAAQKKARAGDRPTGCNHLQSYQVTVQVSSAQTVQLIAICDNTQIVRDTYVMPTGVTLSSPLPMTMKFTVLYGGVSYTGDVTVVSSTVTKQFRYAVDGGGEISEGVVEDIPAH
jgi:prepilin-type N-terminal cleavage/methylation domain-containing protein